MDIPVLLNLKTEPCGKTKNTKCSLQQKISWRSGEVSHRRRVKPEGSAAAALVDMTVSTFGVRLKAVQIRNARCRDVNLNWSRPQTRIVRTLSGKCGELSDQEGIAGELSDVIYVPYLQSFAECVLRLAWASTIEMGTRMRGAGGGIRAAHQRTERPMVQSDPMGGLSG